MEGHGASQQRVRMSPSPSDPHTLACVVKEDFHSLDRHEAIAAAVLMRTDPVHVHS